MEAKNSMKIRTVVTLTYDADRELTPEEVARDVPGAICVSASVESTRLGVVGTGWPTRLVLAEDRGGDNYLLPEGVTVADLSQKDGFEGFPQIGGEEPTDETFETVGAMLKLILANGIATRVKAYTTDNPYLDEYETEDNVHHRIARYHGFCLAEDGIDLSVEEIADGSQWIGYAFVTVAIPPDIAGQLSQMERKVQEGGAIFAVKGQASG